MNKGMYNETTYDLLRNNQEGGIELLYERYGSRLYSYGLKSWNLSEDDCWEMVYQTLYKVLEKIGGYEFESEKKFGSFIFTVFCNFLRRLYRDSQRISEHLSFANYDESRFDLSRGEGGLATERQVQSRITEISMDSYQEESAVENPLMTVLEEVLDELEPWQRILVLQRAQNRPYTEIADFVDRPANQLKVYYSRIMKLVEKRMHERVQDIKQEVNG
ncbi:MAG: sigma-70 family RNA polymerase sigma factor [Bacteroidia bacterium]|nr:sigma-70 family RNA polymerase sigma factor [Bacteroidia bacterium]